MDPCGHAVGRRARINSFGGADSGADALLAWGDGEQRPFAPASVGRRASANAADLSIDVSIGRASAPWLGRAEAYRRKAGRSQGRGRRTAALFMSIRSLIVIASVLEVGGAVACTWAITYLFSARSLESVAQLLVTESHEETLAVIERYLDQAYVATEANRRVFELGFLTKSDWRTALAHLHGTVSGGAFEVSIAARRRRGLLHDGRISAEGATATRALTSPAFQSFVHFVDGTTYGVLRCNDAEPLCPTGYRSFVSNDTFLSSYSSDPRGQPIQLQVAGPIDRPMEIFKQAMDSPEGALYSDVFLRPAVAANMTVADRMLVAYAARVTRLAAPRGTAATELAKLPEPLASRFGAGDAATASAAGDGETAVVGSAVHIGALSGMLREVITTPDSLAFLTTADGKLVATSTGATGDLYDARARRILSAAESPNPLIRAVYDQRALHEAGDTVVRAELLGRAYFAGRSGVAHKPFLQWQLFMATPRQTLLQGIDGSTLVNVVVNSIWLVVSIVVAVLLGLRITKPLVTLRQSMVQLAQTMTSVAAEFREEASVRERDAGAPGLATARSVGRPPGVASPGEPGSPLGSPPAAGARAPSRLARALSWVRAPFRGHPRVAHQSDLVTRDAGTPPELEPSAKGEREREVEAPHADGQLRARQSVALGTGLQELSAFEDIIRAMQSGFSAFRDMSATELALMRSLLAERKTKLEMEVRADETRKFISTMSHEMRTPLNGILGMLQLARDCDLPEEAAEFVENASLSGEHLLSIVNDVLDLQKIEAGLIELQIAPTRVVDVVSASVRIVQPRAGAKGIVITSAIGPDVPPLVLADPDRTRQCLLNLVSNAVKYTLRGSVHVDVSLDTVRVRDEIIVNASVHGGSGFSPGSSIHGAGGTLRPPLVQFDAPDETLERFLKFSVSDTGPGISPEAQRQLFTRFYRVRYDPALGPDPGGTGLGLAISKEIISRMGGEIGCSSEIGRGSCFYFTIPLQPVDGEGSAGSGQATAANSPLASHPPSFEQLVPHEPRLSAVLAVAPPTPELQSIAELEDENVGGRSLHLAPAHSDRDWNVSVRSSVLASAPGAVCGARSGPPLAVLVVEDNAMNMRVLRTMLEKEGHRVTEARDGREALATFEGAALPEFGLVFMDCSMPVMDGLEATRRIRELERQRGWPRHFIVALTGHASAEDGDACLAAGMDKWLTKPIRKSVLLDTVEALTGVTPQRRSGSKSPAPLSPASGPARPRSTPALDASGLRRAQSSPPAAAGAPLNVAPPPLALPPAALECEDLAASVAEAALERPAAELASPPTSPAAHAASLASPFFGRRSSLGEGELEPAAARALEVLIADDNQMNRRVLRALLAKEGHRVHVAEDGAQAAAMFEGRARGRAAEGKEVRGGESGRGFGAAEGRQGREGGAPDAAFEFAYDIVLMDVSMPRMDGLQATRRIREIERELLGPGGSGLACPIVACTALSSSQDHANAMDAGMSDLVVKPVTRANLLALLAKWCGRGGPPAGPFPSSGRSTPQSSPLVTPSPLAGRPRRLSSDPFGTRFAAALEGDRSRSVGAPPPPSDL